MGLTSNKGMNVMRTRIMYRLYTIAPLVLLGMFFFSGWRRGMGGIGFGAGGGTGWH